MLRFATILLLILSLNSIGFAQERGERQRNHREMIESQKISYFTQKLKLTPQEAQLFWPLYNEMQAKKDELSASRKEAMKKFRGGTDQLSEKELDELSDHFINMQIKTAELHKEYHYKFKEVLPPLKIIKLYQAERQFQGMLLKRIKEHGFRGRGGREKGF